jgi:FAD/FMN-containing dehydrogenase
MPEMHPENTPEHRGVSRRLFLRGAVAAAAVVGFDVDRRSWATEADVAAGHAAATALDFPDFDGELLTDDAFLDAAADDYGHTVSRRPVAVLVPGSVDDIVALVRFARLHRIGVVARGQGHSTFGQAQAEAGVVIEMSVFDTVHEVNAADAVVDAGVTWLELLQQTIPAGLAPPVLTDYIELSIGGTLSAGGVGAQTFHSGAQIDSALELQVVTGRGNLVTCSPHHRRRLFHAVLAGLGQFAIIVRARLRLVPAPPSARLYQATYDQLTAMTGDQRRLLADRRFDTVQGSAVPDGAGGWLYVLEATKNFAPGDEPDDDALTGDLNFLPGQLVVQDLPYFDYLNRLAPIVELLKQIGVWYFPHPWIDLFLPDDQAEGFIADTLAELTVDDVGQGPVLINPYHRDAFAPSFLRLPHGDVVFLFALLRNAIPPTPERAAELVAANRALFEAAVGAGGLSYPIDSVPKERIDWLRHYGPLWPAFALAKLAYDPDQILAPGQGIFT